MTNKNGQMHINLSVFLPFSSTICFRQEPLVTNGTGIFTG